MPCSRTTVKVIFNSVAFLRIVINILTLLMLIIVIAACISVGIVQGTRKITASIQTSTVRIVQSNMKIVLNRQVASFERPYTYYLSSHNNGNNADVTYALNDTLNEFFPGLLLHVVASPLSVLSRDTSDPSTYLYVFYGEAFFNSNQTVNEIKDSLEHYQLMITLLTIFGSTSSISASFNRLLSNVSNTQPTNFTLSDLDGIVLTNGFINF